ncbi:MAG: glycerol-3-phosphate acyltransferase [Melioribacteraceae bacterium]|nr:glycerol-3-phosphate acyltransferase [Melioribacteraceae bacterium]
MEYLIIALFSYLIGSFPTAFVLLKKVKQIDITQNGSGNVGALNSYEVSNSKLIGVTVLLIDALKGLGIVYLSKILFGNDFLTGSISLLFGVTGHCFSPWIKFKGGRGLATAAGGSLILAPAILILWLLFWLLAYLFRKNIHFGNITATILTGLLSLSSSDILNKYSIPPADENFLFGVSVMLLMIVIFIKHINPLKEYIDQQKNKIRS